MTVSMPLFPVQEDEQLAQSCASSGLACGESALRQFAELQAEAKKGAKAVASTGLKHEAAWDGLLPTLDKMQRLLSQRGANRKQRQEGLPKWGSWWRDFNDKNQLGLSFRTVQHRLARYQGSVAGKKQYRAGTTWREQSDLAISAEQGHLLAAACKSGLNAVDAAEQFYSASLPIERIVEIKERLSLRKNRNLSTNRTELVKSIFLNLGPRVRECMDGLTGAEAASLLQLALSTMIDRFCHQSGIYAKIECSAPQLREPGRIRTSLDRDAA